MTPAASRASYRRIIGAHGEPVLIRRYTGSGSDAAYFEAEVRARVMGYDKDELVDGVQQGTRKVIVIAEDLEAAQFALPVTADDKVIIRGQECNIEDPDDSTRRISGALIAYELKAKG